MQNVLERVAKQYERIAVAQCQEAEEAGEDAPKLVSVFARQGGYTVDFLAPLPALSEIRDSIRKAGGEYRTVLI